MTVNEECEKEKRCSSLFIARKILYEDCFLDIFIFSVFYKCTSRTSHSIYMTMIEGLL